MGTGRFESDSVRGRWKERSPVVVSTASAISCLHCLTCASRPFGVQDSENLFQTHSNVGRPFVEDTTVAVRAVDEEGRTVCQGRLFSFSATFGERRGVTERGLPGNVACTV